MKHIDALGAIPHVHDDDESSGLGLPRALRSSIYPSHSIPGRTTAECPDCHTPRKRFYKVEGPYSRKEIDAFKEEHHKNDLASLTEIKPSKSASLLWGSFGLAWLVSPYHPSRSERYYLVGISAKCNNEYCPAHHLGTVEVVERGGYRRYGWSGIAWNRFKASIHWEVVISEPAQVGQTPS